MIDIKRAIRLNRGSEQGQFSYWDDTLKKWDHTETSELFWDDTNKRVGIGTDSPDYKLDVNGQIRTTTGIIFKPGLIVKSQFVIGGGDNQHMYFDNRTELGDIYFRTYLNDTRMTINGTSGNVGIGTATPNNKLQVAGLISFDDTLRNLALGTEALDDITTGDNNIGIAYQALKNNEDGKGNLGIGYRSLLSNVGGDYNVGIGYETLYSSTSNQNIAIGYQAQYGATGSSSIGIGRSALRNNEGTSNLGIGNNALYDNTEGEFNVALGVNSFIENTEGSNNVGIGTNSGYNNLIGDNNIFIGFNAGYRQTTNSNLLIIDNQLRADVATEATNAILYGVMASTPASQTLAINADILGTIGAKIGDGGTTNYTEIKSDGEINLHGTARVYKNQWVNVQGLKAPGTKPATLVDWGVSCAWEFTNGTDDTICTSIRIPQDMDRTVAPELKIGFASDTNTGDVVWQLEYLYLTPNEDTTAAAQETLTTTTTISGTADGLTIATITGMDLPSSTDQLVKFRIKRLGADGADTLSDDCVLIGCGLKYVSDKLGQGL